MGACGGSPTAPGAPAPAQPPPPVPPPASVGDISLRLVSASPAENTPVRRGAAHRFVARLHYSAGTSPAGPLFLVAQLRQFAGPTPLDSPDDFHFATPGRSGEVEAVIDRTTIDSAGVVRITWILAMANPDRSTFPGASFTTSYPVP